MFAVRLQVCKLPYLCGRAVLHCWQKGDSSRTRRVGGGSSSRPHLILEGLRAALCPRGERAARSSLAALQNEERGAAVHPPLIPLSHSQLPRPGKLI